MHILRFSLVVLLLCATAVSAQVYKYIDEDGVVHYTDQPVAGAERIDIDKRPASAAARRSAPQRRAPDTETQPAADQPFGYQSLTFSSPVAEQTLWNIGGVLNVSVSLAPGLRTGDRVRLYFDGNPQTITGTGVELQEVWRGTHNLQAEVVDPSGKVLIRSKPIRFYVQQTSILN